MPRAPTYLAATRRAYTAGHFDLMIDGISSLAYVKSVEGGWPKLNATEDPGGATTIKVKHRTTYEVEPITFEVGMAQCKGLLWWIRESWEKTFARKDGQILHANQDYQVEFIQHFEGALIEEVTFPALDAGSKEAAYLKVKIRPERVRFERVTNGPKLRSDYRRYNRMWLSSCFRLNLDNGVDTRLINKIDGFTVKQGVKALATGEQRVPQLEPTKVDFPDLKVTMSLAHADSVFRWYEKTVGRMGEKAEMSDQAQECEGSIEFLDPACRETLLELNLYGVALKSFTIPKSEANSDQIKRCTFELSIDNIKIEENDLRMLLES